MIGGPDGFLLPKNFRSTKTATIKKSPSEIMMIWFRDSDIFGRFGKEGKAIVIL
jgi:hypothetical protein